MIVRAKPWMRWVLGVAAAYSFGWGLWWFYAQTSPVWREAGIFSAILGVGLAFASRDPLKHWTMVLMSLLANLAAAVAAGFWISAAVWTIPFLLILRVAHDNHRQRRILASPEIQRFALRAKTQYDVSLLEMSQLSPVLLVFLRHFGCTFCRQALSDLKRQKHQIEADGVRIALVHMGMEDEANEFLTKYGLSELPRVSDTRQAVYKAFGLDRGKFMQMFGLKTWLGGFQSVVMEGNSQGMTVGDSFQMPGVFLIFHGEVLKSYRHQSPADRPNYVSLALSQDSPVPS